MEGDIAEALKNIGAGLAIGLGDSAPGSGSVCSPRRRWSRWGAIPEAAGPIQQNMILAIAFTEAIAIYALVVAVIIKYSSDRRPTAPRLPQGLRGA